MHIQSTHKAALSLLVLVRFSIPASLEACTGVDTRSVAEILDLPCPEEEVNHIYSTGVSSGLLVSVKCLVRSPVQNIQVLLFLNTI